MKKNILCVLVLLSTSISSDKVGNFAFSLYKELEKKDSISFVVSPSSIYSALFMACLGAGNGTKKEILEVLSIDHIPNMPADFFVSSSPSILQANSVWLQEEYRIKDTYLSSLSFFFENEVLRANFSEYPNKSRLKINSWIAESTNNKVQSLLKPNDISRRTRLVLVNALYMLSNWKKAFERSKTASKDFFLLNGTIKLPTMHLRDRMIFFEDGHLKSISLELEDSLLFTVILPNSNTMMRYVESNLDMSYFNLILKSSKFYDVDFSMPKINLDYSISLKDHLISMGVNQAFIDGKANFSNIRDENDLTISDVLHQSTLSLDEEGVEASSATAVVIRVKTTAKKKRKEFKANRPFIFIISDQKNNLIHFMGKFSG